MMDEESDNESSMNVFDTCEDIFQLLKAGDPNTESADTFST